MIGSAHTAWATWSDLGPITFDACLPWFISVGILAVVLCCLFTDQDNIEEAFLGVCMAGVLAVIMGGALVTFLLFLIARMTVWDKSSMPWVYLFIPTYLFDGLILLFIAYLLSEEDAIEDSFTFEFLQGVGVSWYPGFVALRVMLIVEEEFDAITIPSSSKTLGFAAFTVSDPTYWPTLAHFFTHSCNRVLYHSMKMKTIVAVDYLFQLAIHLKVCPCNNDDLERLCNCGFGRMCPWIAAGLGQCVDNPCCACDRCQCVSNPSFIVLPSSPFLFFFLFFLKSLFSLMLTVCMYTPDFVLRFQRKDGRDGEGT